MPVARKDVADKLNEHALECAEALVNIALGKDTGGDAHIRLGALKTVLAKCVPDLKAVDLSGEIKAELGKITIDLAND